MTYELASSSWDEAEIDAIQRVIKSRRFTMGPYVKQFEKDFAAKFGARFAVMTHSGSSANLIGIAALCFKKEGALQRGDEVIVPAIAWATTYYPLQQYGLKLRFVDVDLKTLNVDMAQLRQAITPKTRMIVAVNILGNPAAVDEMRALCDEKSIILFEDNCESMGAEIQGKACGTFGDIGTYSLFYSHHISTMEGGVAVTDDEELYHLLKSLRAHGWTRDIPDDSPLLQDEKDDVFEAYRFILPGYNVRPLEINAAIGIEQLKKFDILLAIRRKNAAFFVEHFKHDARFILQQENAKSAWFSFTLIIDPACAITRADVFKVLKAANIEHRIVTGGNFIRHRVIQHFDYDCTSDLNNANHIHDNGFFVGNHPRDIRLEIEKLYETLQRMV